LSKGARAGGGAVVCGTCSSPLAPNAEYCLTCGVRIPGARRVGARPVVRGRILRSALVLAVAAVAGAAGAILLTRDSTAAPTVQIALGGNVPVEATAGGPDALATWSRESGWTIVLVSVPKSDGREAALAVAEAAQSRSLPAVGILDSSRVASTRPGFWLVFTGSYASEAEANGSLRAARALVKTARVQRIAR
jgi:hypothetical protein